MAIYHEYIVSDRVIHTKDNLKRLFIGKAGPQSTEEASLHATICDSASLDFALAHFANGRNFL